MTIHRILVSLILCHTTLRQVPETYDFLGLSMDDDLIPLHFQRVITPLIAKWRTPQVEKQYADIQVYRDTRSWQCELLDELHPETAPHKPYVLSRCANPLTQETVQKMKAGVKRAGEMGDIEWSMIDRWGMHPGFIKARSYYPVHFTGC